MNKLYSQFLKFSKKNFRRNLSWLDRDEDSPTFGSFDRNFWHYKTTDFNSDILQQGIYTLIGLYKKDIPNNYKKNKIKKLIKASVNFIFKNFENQKFFNEYYPNENGYPPIAFLSNMLGDVFFDFPEFFKNEKFKINYIKINIDLSKLSELHASNQYSIGLSGLYKFLKFFPEYKKKIQIRNHKKNFLSLQDKEGWFNEYDGYDLGYLSITLESILNIYEITNDKDFLRAANLVIKFYSEIIDKDGNFPYTLNSRNTEYILPYGFLKAMKFNKKVNSLFYSIYKNFNNSSHFVNAIDDRYTSHYIFSSFVKSLPYLKKIKNFKKMKFKKNITLKNAGLIKRFVDKKNITIFISILKGGIIRIHDHSKKTVYLQNGYRALDFDKLSTNNFQSKNWRGNIQKRKFVIIGNFIDCRFLEPNTFKHLILRLCSYLFNKKIIKFLKNDIIFNKTNSKLKFRREIQIGSEITIKDTFIGFKNQFLKLNNKQNLRHVASADTFSDEDMIDDISNLKNLQIKNNQFKIVSHFKL